MNSSGRSQTYARAPVAAVLFAAFSWTLLVSVSPQLHARIHADAHRADHVCPVTLIAPWPAGGAVDTLCRIFAARLTERLGKSVIVENRPGAGSVLGVAAAARAAPDGYTLVMAGSAALATTVTIYRALPYDPTKDFVPLALITRIPFVLVVNPSLPVRSVTELLALARKHPGRLSYHLGRQRQAQDLHTGKHIRYLDNT